MNGSIIQLTLRRWADGQMGRWAEVFACKNIYILFAVVVLVSGTIGPFGTYDAFSFMHRLGFWFLIHTICWTIGLLSFPAVRIFFEVKGMKRPHACLLSLAFSNSIVGPIFVWSLCSELGKPISAWELFEGTLLFTPVVAILIFAGTYVTGLDLLNKKDGQRQNSNGPEPYYSEPDKCAVQSKLPFEKRGVIWAMVAQDHYTEVITNKGSELVLMRLSDGADHCDCENGLRIHRSVWVSRDEVERLEKAGRKTLLVLRNGRELLVARSKEEKARRFVEAHKKGFSEYAQFS